MSRALDFFKNYVSAETSDPLSVSQAEILDEILSSEFNFEYIECIETGCVSGNYDNFGIYLAQYCKNLGGKFTTVDISSENIERSKLIFERILGKNDNRYFIGDSVSFLKNYKGSPNLIHLDSLDLDIKNPVPSMLHGWMEFNSIREKMPSGSICIIDDNFLKGTIVYWDWFSPDGQYLSTEEIEISYDIVGKGSLIYHWSQREDSDWDIIGDHYNPGGKIKLIIKKR